MSLMEKTGKATADILIDLLSLMMKDRLNIRVVLRHLILRLAERRKEFD